MKDFRFGNGGRFVDPIYFLIRPILGPPRMKIMQTFSKQVYASKLDDLRASLANTHRH